jgi:DNA-binding NarL/FixJ family response regulator
METLPLTSREKEILMHLSSGLQYKEIAEVLNISFETVKSHVANIYAKLKVNNRTEAMLKSGVTGYWVLGTR